MKHEASPLHSVSWVVFQRCLDGLLLLLENTKGRAATLAGGLRNAVFVALESMS